MTYVLGIDAGTTYTAAAVNRDGNVDIAPLGDHRAVIPSVLFFLDDGTLLTGDVAVRRGHAEPNRVASRFKRRIGDTAPLVVGGAPHSAEALTARLLRWVVAEVSELEGGPPDSIVLTHPANWGPFKRDRLDQAIRMADLSGAVTITEPEAAAIYYASKERVAVGSVIAVYDLGGGTFDAAVMRKTDDGWETLGSPEGIEQLGGIDFDEAVFTHLEHSLPEAFESLDEDDPSTVAAIARIRRDCVEAKEALSSDTEVSIPVLLPSVQTGVRLTRIELEAMLRPTLQETAGAMHRALRSAEIDAAEISAVLLVGGSSRIPLVSQLISVEFGRPVAVDAHPKHAVALGAALAATKASAKQEKAPEPGGGSEPDPEPELEPEARSDRDSPSRWRSRPALMGAAALVAVVVLGLAAVLFLGGGDDDPEEAGNDSDGGGGAVELSIGERIPVGAFPDGIAVDQAGSLWVASTEADEVTRIDPQSLETTVLEMPSGSDPLAVVVTDDGGIWVSLRRQARVIRLDPDSLETTDSVDVAREPSAFGLGAGSLWVVAASGQVDRIDPVARQVIAEIAVASPAGLAVTSESAWVTQSEGDSVAEIDLDSNQVTATVRVGDAPDDIAVDADGFLWIANRGEGTVARLDPTLRQVTDTISVGQAPANLAIAGEEAWVSDTGAGSVVLIDLSLIEVAATIEVGEAPLDLIVDGDRVWVSITAADEVVEVRTSGS